MNIETIIQGGAVGLAAFAMFILWKLITGHFRETHKYIRENTTVLTGLKDAIISLKDFLKNGK